MWRTFNSLSHALFGKRQHNVAPRRRRPCYRPNLESLEDRAVPASLSYFNTSLNATVYATAVDSVGDTYVTGLAGSSLPTTPGAFETIGSGTFVAKLNSAGALVYATYLSSDAGDGLGGGSGIAVDAAGDAYVLGAYGANFAMTANAIVSSPNSKGSTDFVAELNPTGSGLIYATYLPGAADGTGVSNTGAIAVDGTGNIYVAGAAGSGLPVTAGAFQTSPGGAYFMKINPALSGTASVLYATYFGSSAQATGIAVDGAGNAYLEGYTNSGLPTTSGAFQTTYSGGNNIFVAKFDPALSGTASRLYSTYLSGSTSVDPNFPGSGDVPTEDGLVVPEIAGGIAVDSAGDAYVTSATTDTDFPTTPGAYQTTSNLSPSNTYPNPPACDVFVTKLNATGSALVYSTYLGGGTINSHGTNSGGAGIAVDANGDAYVTGWTNSTSFPTMNAVQSTNNGRGFYGFDSFVTELNPAGSGLLFSTYLGTGGSNDYLGYGIALDSAGNVYAVGGINQFSSSGFVARITLAPSPSFAVAGFPSSTTAGVAHTFTVTALNANGTVNTGYTGTVQFTSSDPQAVLPPAYTFTAADQGVHTFTVTLKAAGSQSITATDTATGSITGSESGIVIQPAAASKFVLSAPSSVSKGAKFSVTLTVEDAYGNVVTGYTGTVRFSSSDSTATLPANYTFTSADAGVHTFSNKVILRKKGTQTLTVTDTLNSALTATDNVTVN
jgi:hypothetical protein